MLFIFHMNLNARYSVSLVLIESDNGIDSLEKLALQKEVTPASYNGTSIEVYFKVG